MYTGTAFTFVFLTFITERKMMLLFVIINLLLCYLRKPFNYSLETVLISPKHILWLLKSCGLGTSKS